MTPEEHSDKTARELDWAAVLSRIAVHCHGRRAAQYVEALRPEPSLEAARARMLRTREAMRLCEEAPLPAARLADFDESFDQLAVGSLVDGQRLAELGTLLELAERLRLHLNRHADAAPTLRAWLTVAPELQPLGEAIRRSIDVDGSVLDAASPALAKLRRSAHSLRGELRQRLQGLLSRFDEAMQGQYVAEREGRYVLPVRADAPFRVAGLTFGSSSSGGTLYVEPAETHELGNRLQRAEAQVSAEEARVLRELSTAVRAQLDDVRAAAEACVQADCLRALARYARDSLSLAIEPDDRARLDLKAMRHPLLIGQAPVVPNDLKLESGHALVLSGPNAGGKTVGLKCLGLAAWMVRSGVPLPVDEGSVVGFFEPVLTDVGDHQSLMHSLSTFSAHVRHLGDCVARATPSTLVLVDELAGGTDPDEGAALAGALTRALIERGAAACVTTHYRRLTSLAAESTDMHNAAVGFDRERLQPTFEIEYGAPGASSAFLVARRHGVPERIVHHAERLLPDSVKDQRALASELDEQREKFRQAAARVEAECRTVASLRAELERERDKARQREQSQLGKEARVLLTEVREARTRLREAQKGLARPDASAQRKAQRAANDAARFVAIDGKLTRATSESNQRTERSEEAAPTWQGLQVGTRVRVVALGQTGEVLAKPTRDRVSVSVGAVKLTVSASELRLVASPSQRPSGGHGNPRSQRQRRGQNASTTAAPHRSTAEAAESETPRTSDNTCNLIGQRVEDALVRLDGFIDRLLRDGEPGGFVLHGHGTGALKKAVRRHLTRHRQVSRATPAEREDGGDAFTAFWIA